MKSFKQHLFENKKPYVGNCVNSFDEDGECFGNLPYNDVTEFAHGDENAKKISKEEFEKHVDIPEHLKKIHNSNHVDYLHDKDNNVHMMYDHKSDVHHFFYNLK
jgi:hypothetical protein